MGDGILSGPLDIDAPRRQGRTYPRVPATPGLSVTHYATSVTGTVLRCNDSIVIVRDPTGRDRTLRNGPGAFMVDGKPVHLVTPTPAAGGPQITASGSIAAADTGARVARASRIWVEGIHDAELVEKVWGDDLRHEGIVVEPLHGVDDLVAVVRQFGPQPGRRLGILVDHLVADSKEQRIAASVSHPDVLVRGHVFVDIWAAVNPRRVGLEAWPDIPHGIPWKDGICKAVGVDDPALFWKTILANVRGYRDLDVSLVGSVEALIDFVTES
jgi:hypothetical protein